MNSITTISTEKGIFHNCNISLSAKGAFFDKNTQNVEMWDGIFKIFRRVKHPKLPNQIGLQFNPTNYLGNKKCSGKHQTMEIYINDDDCCKLKNMFDVTIINKNQTQLFKNDSIEE